MFAKECIPPKNVYCLKIQLKQLPLVCMFIMLIMEFYPKKSTFSMKKMKMSLQSLLDRKQYTKLIASSVLLDCFFFFFFSNIELFL